MYSYWRTKNAKPSNDGSRNEITYWRKHYALHEWMQELWQTKLNSRSLEDQFLDALDDATKYPDGFNCVEVELTSKDLDALEADLDEMHRNDEPHDHQISTDLDFIAKAREHLKKQHKVFYNSWW